MSIAITHPDVTGRIERNEVLLAFRGLIEQVRLGLRDGRRLIRRLIAACEMSTGSSTAQMTSSPTPLVSVPLVVLRPTTDREQIELDDLVQSLGADGYQVAPRGPQWVVYTEIADRRKSAVGGSPQDRRGLAGMGEARAIVLETRPETPGRLRISQEKQSHNCVAYQGPSNARRLDVGEHRATL
jgi:hypothetical protein